MKIGLFSEKFVPHKFHPRNTNVKPCVDEERTYIKRIAIEESRSGNHDVSEEAYSLEVSNDGTTIIRVISAHGGLHALNTFSQLFYTHSESASCIYTPYAPIRIRDSPMFEQRPQSRHLQKSDPS